MKRRDKGGGLTKNCHSVRWFRKLLTTSINVAQHIVAQFDIPVDLRKIGVELGKVKESDEIVVSRKTEVGHHQLTYLQRAVLINGMTNVDITN